MEGGYSMKLWVEVYSPGLKTHTRRIYFWHPGSDFCGLLEPNLQLNSTFCFRPWNKTYPFSGKKYKNPYPISNKRHLKTIPFGAVHIGIYIADLEEFIPPCNPLERSGELENSGSTIKDINHKNWHTCTFVTLTQVWSHFVQTVVFKVDLRLNFRIPGLLPRSAVMNMNIEQF